MTRLQQPAVLVLALALAAGCGGGSTAKAKTDTAPTEAAAKAAATAVNLLAADVPGFTGEEHDATKEADQLKAEKSLQECMGISYLTDAQRDVFQGYSPDFGKDAGGLPIQVATQVEVLRSAKVVSGDIAGYTSSKAAGCVGTFIAEGAKSELSDQGATVGEPTVKAVTLDRAGNDAAFGFDVTVPLSGQGQTVQVYVNLRAFASKHTETSLETFSVGTPFDAAELTRVSALVASRTAAHAV